MKYHIDKNSKTPGYMQLYLQLRQDITNGLYKFGAKLPSKRLLAEEASTSVITIEHTYDILQSEGYIEARSRSGYFVIYKEKDFFVVAENKNTADTASLPIFHSVSNDAQVNHSKHEFSADVFPFSVLSKTMRRVLSEYGEKILIKSPNQGLLELRNAISEYLARNVGVVAKPNQIVIGSGSEYLYGLALQLLGNSNIFAIEDPCYDKIKQVYTAYNINFDGLQMGINGIKTSELLRSKARILHVTPFNSYPSNVTADISKRNEYIDWAEKRDGYIIEDNYGAELTLSTKNEDTVFSMSKSNRVIYMNTFSKTIAPSIRVGYMVLPESLLGDFQEKLGFYSCTVPVFEQYVLAELISSGDFERHINRQRRYGRTRK